MYTFSLEAATIVLTKHVSGHCQGLWMFTCRLQA